MALTASALTAKASVVLAYVKVALVRVASVDLKDASVLSAPVPVLQKHPQFAPVVLPVSVQSLEDAREPTASADQIVGVCQEPVHVE